MPPKDAAATVKATISFDTWTWGIHVNTAIEYVAKTVDEDCKEKSIVCKSDSRLRSPSPKSHDDTSCRACIVSRSPFGGLWWRTMDQVRRMRLRMRAAMRTYRDLRIPEICETWRERKGLLDDSPGLASWHWSLEKPCSIFCNMPCRYGSTLRSNVVQGTSDPLTLGNRKAHMANSIHWWI